MIRLHEYSLLPLCMSACIALTGCGSGETAEEGTPPTTSVPVQQSVIKPPAVKQPAAKKPLGVMMATLDGVQNDRIKVNRFRTLLKSLDDSCKENAVQIADLTVHSKGQAEGFGVAVSNLDIMESIDRALPLGTNESYGDFAAGYLATRKNGYSQDETTKLLPALVKEFREQQKKR